MTPTRTSPMLLHVLWLALASAACEPGTGGEPITFALSVAAAPATPDGLPGRFTTSTGWDVALEQACIAVGPIYFFAGPGHLQQAARPVPRRLFATLSRMLLPAAHAHPGDTHFDGGEVQGEWLSQLALDALSATPRQLGSTHDHIATSGPFCAATQSLPRAPITRSVMAPSSGGETSWARVPSKRNRPPSVPTNKKP